MQLRLALASVLITAPTVAGTWQRLPAAPIKVDAGLASIWTGKEMIVSGVSLTRTSDGAILKSANVAAAYDPKTNRWRSLAPPAQPTDLITGHHAVWTGREMLVWGAFSTLMFNPATGRWRQLRRGHGGLVVWTGRELIGWGGGCCGDAFSDGVAYNPATNTWRSLRRSPLAGSQAPVGAWTGKELFVFVGNFDPDGKPWPARLARAAAYDPATNTWRRVAPMPQYRGNAKAVWDGREILVVGGGTGFAYTPATNRWRPLLRAVPAGAAAVWTGKQLLVSSGLAYDPNSDRWSRIPPAPAGGMSPAAVWSGTEMIVWGEGRGAAFRSRS